MPTKGGATGKFYCLILTENSAPFLLFIFYYHELKSMKMGVRNFVFVCGSILVLFY